MKPRIYLSLLVFIMTFAAGAQAGPETGPVIDAYGAAFEIPNPDLAVDPEQAYKLVLDVSTSPADPERLNPMINTVARYLNMHARAGVPLKNLQVALVLHGQATKDALNDEAYDRRYSVSNPNLDLLAELKRAGVKTYLCGQSAAFSGYQRDELADSVGLALSALTALVTLQSQGYRLVSW